MIHPGIPSTGRLLSFPTPQKSNHHAYLQLLLTLKWKETKKVFNVQHLSCRSFATVFGTIQANDSRFAISAYNPTSVRMISNRVATTTITTEPRNSPGLFVSNSGLIPLSAAATAAPTTAVSLFASSRVPSF